MTARMATVEEQVTANSDKLVDVEKQIQSLLAGITKASARTEQVVALADKAVVTANKAIEAIDKTTKECQELRATTEKISTTQDRMLVSITHVEKSLEGFGARLHHLEGSPPAAASRIPGPVGHSAAHDIQGIAHERVLANGAYTLPRNQSESGPSHRQAMHNNENSGNRTDRYERDTLFRLSKTNFPKFDGTNPRIWKEKCEKYFHMFYVPDDLKADYATLHFSGNAALWLQTYEVNHTVDTWVALCVSVCNKFGKDIYYTSMN